MSGKLCYPELIKYEWLVKLVTMASKCCIKKKSSI